jgi:hypothetical protein
VMATKFPMKLSENQLQSRYTVKNA